MKFEVTNSWGNYDESIKSKVFLAQDNWNDFGFKTTYGIFYVNENSVKIDLGAIKIGRIGQNEQELTLDEGFIFEALGEQFFSVGIDEYFYENLKNLGNELSLNILESLRDIAFTENLLEKIINEPVTEKSLLRSISQNIITGQYRRIALGGAMLTNYNFKFTLNNEPNENPPIGLTFNIEPQSMPSSNIHVIIGRNGVGKTYLINDMIISLTSSQFKDGSIGAFSSENENIDDFFANVVYVSFSAFEEFNLPIIDNTSIKYSYIGIASTDKESANFGVPKSHEQLKNEFQHSLLACVGNSKGDLWNKIILILESDPLFRSAQILSILDESESDSDRLIEIAGIRFDNLSSGHKIILLTVTRLVETVHEKSLVLFDEPESHLHPPLLSSFIGAISELLVEKNGVGIIATHSPVILQEVPRSCVWKLRKHGNEAAAERLEIESYGENVGILTHEVFGLEVTSSGYHKMLKELVEEKDSYDEVIDLLKGKLGLEGKAILRSLFYQKGK